MREAFIAVHGLDAWREWQNRLKRVPPPSSLVGVAARAAAKARGATVQADEAQGMVNQPPTPDWASEPGVRNLLAEIPDEEFRRKKLVGVAPSV